MNRVGREEKEHPLAAAGWGGKAPLPRTKDAGMCVCVCVCVCDHFSPRGYQGAALSEVNPQPSSQCQEPLFPALSLLICSRMWLGCLKGAEPGYSCLSVVQPHTHLGFLPSLLFSGLTCVVLNAASGPIPRHLSHQDEGTAWRRRVLKHLTPRIHHRHWPPVQGRLL
jgi:hypothetical protein